MALYTLCVHLQIVHGDLKSLNILLTRGWQLAKLGDVGVARYLKSKDVPDHVAREAGSCHFDAQNRACQLLCSASLCH